MREQLLVLKRRWTAYRRFLHAYKHAGLLTHPELVMLVDGKPSQVFAAWQRHKSEPQIGAYMARPLDGISRDAARTGQLAADILEHLVDTRLQVFEFIDVAEDGRITPRPMDRLPWRLWMRPKDVGDENLARLRDRLGTVQI